MEFEFQIKEKIHKISVDFKDGSYQLALEGKTFEVEAEEISDNSLVLFLKGEGGILPNHHWFPEHMVLCGSHHRNRRIPCRWPCCSSPGIDPALPRL